MWDWRHYILSPVSYTHLDVYKRQDEYRQARESTLSSFYTSPVVIDGIYKALENMEFRYGNILEPSCGIGRFFGMLPDSMKPVSYTHLDVYKRQL